jgi:hypothetical protein
MKHEQKSRKTMQWSTYHRHLAKIKVLTSHFSCFLLRNFAHGQEISGMLANCLDFSRRTIGVLSKQNWKHSMKYINVRYQQTTSFLESSEGFIHKCLRYGTVSMSDIIPLTRLSCCVCSNRDVCPYCLSVVVWKFAWHFGDTLFESCSEYRVFWGYAGNLVQKNLGQYLTLGQDRFRGMASIQTSFSWLSLVYPGNSRDSPLIRSHGVLSRPLQFITHSHSTVLLYIAWVMIA